MPDQFGGIEVASSPSNQRDQFGGIPIGDAQNLGRTRERGKGPTVFGEVTQGREPGLAPVSFGELGGEMVRRTLNVPTQLVYGQEMFPPGASLLPAAGVEPILDKLFVMPGTRQLGVPTEQMDRELYERFGVPIPPDRMAPTMEGLKKGVLSGIEKFATPENAAIAIGAAVAPEAGIAKEAVHAGLLSYFFPQIVGQALPEAAGHAYATVTDPNASPMEKGSAVGETAVTGLMTLGLGKEALGRAYSHRIPAPQLLPPQFNRQTLLPQDLDELEGRVPLERRLPPGRMLGAQQAQAEARLQPPPAVGPMYMGPQSIEGVNKQLQQRYTPLPPGLVSGEAEPMLPEGYKLKPWETQRRKGGKFTKPPGEEPPTAPSGPETKLSSGLGDYEQYQDLIAKMKEALDRGDFDAFTRMQQQTEEIKNRQPVRGMPPVKPGDKATIKDLRPAIQVGGRILMGEQGETHADVLLRNGIDPDSIPHEDPRRGFASVSNPNQLISRMDAEKIAGVKGTAKAGGLDSMDLPGGRPKEKLVAVAYRYDDGTIERGEPGQIHAQVGKKYPGGNARIHPKTGEPALEGTFESGFVTDTGKFVPRDSKGAYDAKQLKQERQENAIRELRTDQLSKTQPPGDIQKVEQEIRPGAEAEGAAQRRQAEAQIQGEEGLQGRAGTPPGDETRLLSGIDPEDLKRLGATAGHWIDKNGKMIPTRASHAETAKEILGLEGDLRDESVMQNLWDQMHDAGYLRLRKDPRGILYVTGKPNRAQLSALERYGISHEVSIFEDLSGKVIYQPPEDTTTYFSGIDPERFDKFKDRLKKLGVGYWRELRVRDTYHRETNEGLEKEIELLKKFANDEKDEQQKAELMQQAQWAYQELKYRKSNPGETLPRYNDLVDEWNHRNDKLHSGIDPEDLRKAVKRGLGYAASKIGEGVPKFVYKVTSKGEAKEITDQYDLGKAIAMTGEKHYWMKPDGGLIEGKQPENTHYLLAKQTLKEKVSDPEASDMRDVYKKMRDKGYAKILEQDDAVYVVGDATNEQIRKAQELADKGKKDLFVKNKRYEAPYIEDEEEMLPGTLDEEESRDTMQDPGNYREYDDRDYPDEPYYSGLPVVSTVKDIVDHIFGKSVNRKMDETMRYYAARTAGKTLPHTSSANAEVGNKLVRAAAADVALGVAKAGPVVIRQYKKKVATDLYDAYIKAKLGQKYTKGSTAPPTMGYAEVGRKPIWLRKDLIPELKKVFDRQQSWEDSSLAHYLLNLATDVQLVGPTDLMFHTANMIASMSYSLGKGSDLNDILLNLPGVGTLDAINRVARQWQRIKLNDPQVQRELVGIAKIGGLRGIDPTPGTGFFGWSNRFIQKVDRAGRLARNDMFNDLVKRKLVENTEENRREFINKMGQYNDRLMGQYQSFFRRTFSPFVVAGRTFNRNAMENLLMSTPAKALNPEAYVKMRALNFINLTTSALAVPIVINSLWTGKPFGRPGTDPGMIDTGKDDPLTGRPITIDLLQLNLVRRALRISGLQAAIRGYESGKNLPDTLDDMAKDVIAGIVHPWAGPPARAVYTTLSGKTPEGYTIASDPDKLSSRAAAAATQVNPIAAAWAEGKTQARSDDAMEKYVKAPLLHLAQRYGSVIGLKEGKYPTHEKLLEQEQGQEVGKMDLGDRLLAEQEHEEKVIAQRKLQPPGLRQAEELQAGQKAQKNIVKRGIELKDELGKADRQWLDARGLIMPGFDNKLTLAKTKVYLTEDEMARYTDLIKENVSDAISALRDVYDDLPDETTKQKVYSEMLTEARKVAREQLEAEIVEKNVPKRKKRRFSIFRSAPEEGVPGGEGH